MNAQDGISAVQTAEGALTEVHDMLQRMNELAVKAANGTNSADDRSYIQAEVDQLITEIDRVANTTKFNETYLLKGDGTEIKTVDVPAADAVPVEATYQPGYGTSGVGFAASKAGTLSWYKAGSDQKMTDDEILECLEVKGGAVALKDGVNIYKAAASKTGEYGAQTEDQKVAAGDLTGNFEVVSTKLASATDGTAIEEKDLAGFFNEDGSIKTKMYYLKTGGDATKPADWLEVGSDQIAKFVNVKPGKAAVADGTTEDVEVTKALKLSLHVGADGDDQNKISLEIDAMNAKSIGVSGLKVDTEENATETINTLNAAIKKVSEQRSALGAIQNRLEHTINNLDNVVENTTAAESQIRDTDMATEMVKYSNNNILAQAGQAMLAQSNQANQGVLSLLQ